VKYGLEGISDEECCGFAGNGPRKLITRAFAYRGVTDEETVNRAIADYIADYDSNPFHLTEPFDGVLEMLSGLREQGIKIAIVSNKQDSSVKVASEHYFGVADITGAFLLGLFLSKCKIKSEVARKMNVPSYLFFSPVFFASVGLKVELDGITASLVIFSLILLVIAILTKIIGCGMGAKFCGFTSSEALQVGVGMGSRGEVALIVAQKGYDMGLLDASLFPPIVIVVIATTIITPVMLKKIM
jgi:hypothetical protein